MSCRFWPLSRTPGIAAIPLEPTHDRDDDAFEDGYEDFLIPGPSPMPIERRTNDPHLYRLKIDRLLRAIAQSLGVKRAFLTAEFCRTSCGASVARPQRLGNQSSSAPAGCSMAITSRGFGPSYPRCGDSDPSWC